MRLDRVAAWLIVGCCAALVPGAARAWGDEGHRIIGQIALPLLSAATRAKVDALLAADSDNLTAPDFVSRTVWADRWRDSDRDTTKTRYLGTREWHFVDIELAKPDLRAACFGFPPLAVGTVASGGPAQDCVVAKVETFAAELGDEALAIQERRLALKFLLHFVGDLHQPLHAADNIDQGGNTVQVLFGNETIASRLHAYWDTAVVMRIGTDETRVATELASTFADQRAAWTQGSPDDWANETFTVARDFAYQLPRTRTPDEHGTLAYFLDATYEQQAERAARVQLAKAGFRLAALLNQILDRSGGSP